MELLMITKVEFDHFTAFSELTLPLSSGINILVGENGTGKTHILKAIYALAGLKDGESLRQRLVEIFLPSGQEIMRLGYKQEQFSEGSVSINRLINGELDRSLTVSISEQPAWPDGAVRTWDKTKGYPLDVTFIPGKEMLANAPGFRSLVTTREVHFEKIYVDIIDKALLPPKKSLSDDAKSIQAILGKFLNGVVYASNEEFFLKGQHGDLEFTLLAEGLRKLGLLWVLVQNGLLLKGSVLCWDEPEANLNPSLFRPIVEILLKLQQMGVQIILSTHSYALLKEFDLQTTSKDELKYHALYRDDSDDIKVNSVERFIDISPNAITQTFSDLYDRDVKKSLGAGV